ncbi:hypothetical protein GN157_16880 [Flavobacterium rakeshii]|uniref:Uncharacterized protein n=1 Tax=Flavobacterium rakeshii TaxID=1038845 RepID=A0A6N8HI75_9FLAO|nr:hypothetical protein [Flavobacterium rakeshii]MEE1897451.1 hypothetical protein [Flavobacterium rakeshii]MUV05391.1 hypothetical protein [Flavobacterium rakeshii]
MKKLILIFLISFNCFSQDSCVWFPAKYVEALKSASVADEEYLMPIEAIEFNNNGLFINFFRGEVNPVVYEKVKIDGITKLELPSLKAHVNLKYYSSDYAEQIENTKFYIIIDDNDLILEVILNGNIERIYFVNHINDYVFKDIIESKQYFKKIE